MSNLENKLNQNNNPDIGKIIDQSFTLFKKIVWVLGFGIILLILFLVPISMFTIINVLDIDSIKQFEKISPTLGNNYTYLITNACIGIATAPIITPLIAGFYYVIHLANTNQQFSFSSIFNHYSSKHFKSLALSGFLIAIYTNILVLGLTYVNLAVFGFFIQMFITFLFIYSIPLIIFENQTTLNALSYSSKIAIKHPFTIIISGLFAFIIAMLGIFAFCFGIFFTIGYLYVINYMVYNTLIPIEEN